MENSLIASLDLIENSIKSLKESNGILAQKVKEYEKEIELLKVEVETYKEELTNIKIAAELKNVELAKEINTPVHQSSLGEISVKKDLPFGQPYSSLPNDNKEQIKLKLDGFIEEIDQCIKTIVTKK